MHYITFYRLKPKIDTSTIDFDWLRNLPKGTFGSAYASFMDCRVSMIVFKTHV